MNTDELKTILEQHKLWLEDESGARANLQGANLRGADLRGADLRGANLRGADLCGANLCGADLRGAYLRGAYLRDAVLRGAYLRDAVLRGANLRGADLRGADLRGANLRGADLDYTCLPLWCGSKGMIVDKRIAAQIAAHFCALDCDDADYLAAQTAILEFAKTSHRAWDLGLLEACGECGTIVDENTINTRPIEDDLRKRIAELSQAVGLITTLKPTMVMDADHPLEMAKEVVEHVTARIAELEAESERFTVHSDIERQDDKWIPEVK